MSADPNRDRDRYRKYESGAQKKKNALKRKEDKLTQQGSLLKFFKSSHSENEKIENEDKKLEKLDNNSKSPKISITSCNLQLKLKIK